MSTVHKRRSGIVCGEEKLCCLACFPFGSLYLCTEYYLICFYYLLGVMLGAVDKWRETAGVLENCCAIYAQLRFLCTLLRFLCAQLRSLCSGARFMFSQFFGYPQGNVDNLWISGVNPCGTRIFAMWTTEEHKKRSGAKLFLARRCAFYVYTGTND